MSEKRSNFTGKIGFVLAAAGSAVGLGNIWRFPYLAAKYGGGIFLLVYIILSVTFGFALLCAEIAIGRKTGKSAIAAFGGLDKRFSFVGWIVSVIPMIILPYYSVIGGWVTKYIATYVSGGASKAADSSYFEGFIKSATEPIGWFMLFIGLTALIVLFGVVKGVEKVSKVMMPVLVVLTVFIAVYGLFMPGAIDGLKYYIIPDFEHFSYMTVVAAMGQLFYSMSIAMGIMITYGSYMKKDISIESSVKHIEIFDTGIAFLAGLMIIPAVFAFPSEAGAMTDLTKAGPTLMFITLPKVFNAMPGGEIIGAVFFIMVFFAALTSSISLMETVVSIIADKTKLGRRLICLIVFVGCMLLGLPSSLGFGVLDFISVGGQTILDLFDFVSNSMLMPIVAFLTCIIVGYVIKPKTICDEIKQSGKFKSEKLFTVIIKYVAPVFTVLILVFSILDFVCGKILQFEQFII